LRRRRGGGPGPGLVGSGKFFFPVKELGS
jgi:hypothetical protein